jgi:hypothetical protein
VAKWTRRHADHRQTMMNDTERLLDVAADPSKPAHTRAWAENKATQNITKLQNENRDEVGRDERSGASGRRWEAPEPPITY